MANYQTSQDLVQAVLNVSGELTDGTSGYQSDALTYLNIAYKGLQTGGNIYGIDFSDPWSWAVSRRPLVITLQPAITTIAVTLVQGSYTIALSAIPLDAYGNQISLAGWWLNITSRDEWFQIQAHAVGTLIATLDTPYTEIGGPAFGCTLACLDYDLIDDTIVIDQTNCYIDFAETAGTPLTATIAQGLYQASAFPAAVVSALTAAGAGGQTYSGYWDSVLRKFVFSSSAVFSFLFASGPYALKSASSRMGYDALDYAAATTQIATYSLNSIVRLTSPMVCYRKPANAYSQDAAANGKIFEMSFNSFVRDYPMSLMNSGMVPDRFCVVKRDPNGKMTIRFNGYMSTLASKVEIGWIPRYRALQNNAISTPIVPEEHRKYLVDAAAAMLLEDKSDDKADKRIEMAKAGLQALQHSDRKEASLAGANFGKLVPRESRTRKKQGWTLT